MFTMFIGLLGGYATFRALFDHNTVNLPITVPCFSSKSIVNNLCLERYHLLLFLIYVQVFTKVCCFSVHILQNAVGGIFEIGVWYPP